VFAVLLDVLLTIAYARVERLDVSRIGVVLCATGRVLSGVSRGATPAA
jgi:hypothetical protein